MQKLKDKKIEAEERRKKEEEERRKREEEERKRREEEEKKRREEEERRRREEEERRKREEEERKKQEEERIKREAEERKRQEEERKKQEEERIKREAEERKKQEEERKRQEKERIKREKEEAKMSRVEKERRQDDKKKQEEEVKHKLEEIQIQELRKPEREQQKQKIKSKMLMEPEAEARDMSFASPRSASMAQPQVHMLAKRSYSPPAPTISSLSSSISYGPPPVQTQHYQPQLLPTIQSLASAPAGRRGSSSTAAPTQAVVVKADARLDKILLSQNVDGTWTLTNELCTLLKLNMDAIKSSVPKGVTELLWFTAIVVAFLETTYAANRDEWDLIVDKSLTIFRTNNAPSDLVAQAKSHLPKLIV